MKILVFCPTNPKWPHLYGRTMHSLLRLRWEGVLEYLIMRGDSPLEDRHDRITWKYQRGREAFLRGDYDAMLTAEADMILPGEALERLIDVGADVAYGLYCFRNHPHRWSAYEEVREESAKAISDDAESAWEAWGQVIPVAGVGLGCTLIRRHVLEELDFHREETPSCDWDFAIDCQSKGFVQKCDLGVICGHITSEPRFRIIWPDVEAEGLYREEALQPWGKPWGGDYA